MADYHAASIRNIALLGHGGGGKTTLAEAMLFMNKKTDRLGKVSDGNTMLDYLDEEKKRATSVSTAVGFLELGCTKINLLDAPGQFDFAGGMYEALCACESALIVLSGKSGLTVGAAIAVKQAKKQGKGIAFMINKLNSATASFHKVFATLREEYGAQLCPVVVPVYSGEVVDHYLNLITGKRFKYDGLKATAVADQPLDDNAQEMLALLSENVASADEALMEKYFDGTPFTADELISGLKAGMLSGDIMPVFAGAGQTGEAIDLLCDGFVSFFPAADSRSYKAADKEVETDEKAPFSAIVFKTIADPFVGKLNYLKIATGTFSGDTTVKCARTRHDERMAKAMLLQGGKQPDTKAVFAGDICAVAKLGDVLTGDTLCDPAHMMTLDPIDFIKPSLSVAVYPKTAGEEEKIAAGLARLAEEDPTLKMVHDTETRELILQGLGDQHLDVCRSKLKAKFGVDVELTTPKVGYRETITKKVKVQGRHKKQSGGHGQFGDIWVEFEPCDSDEMVFEEKVFGGSVPRNFFPAVEKGLRECMLKGVLEGYPVVGIKARLVDGSYHPVDSSEMSFKLAAAIAFKAGMAEAGPVMLEPIGTLKAIVPDENMGDVIGDVNKRRGRVMGMNPAEDRMQEIVAEVPAAEMGDFSNALRSITGGSGSFTFAFERYERKMG